MLSIGQSYTETLDSFYVPTPEYSLTLGLDSLHFPCAVTTPDVGSDFPILILVHGTAALDKDANSTKDYLDSVGAAPRKAMTRMFWEIADSLSRNGIMVLRYDKRSHTVNCIEDSACWWVDTISPYDYIKDLNYAIEYAKTLPGVDTCNIFVAGHSQGGSFVADAGYKRNDVRGVIGLAPTAQPVDTVAVFQVATVDQNPAGAMVLSAQFDSLRAGLWPMDTPLTNFEFSPRFWLDWLDITDSAITTQQLITVPTLFMYGTIDKFVPPGTHLQLWMDSITRPDVTFLSFAQLDHSLGTEYDSTMSPAVLDSLTQWILSNSTANCTPSGLADITSVDAFTVFPNPTKGELIIQGLNERAHVELWSITGQRLWSTTTSDGLLDLTNAPPGVYLLRITTGTSRQTVKVIRH